MGSFPGVLLFLLVLLLSLSCQGYTKKKYLMSHGNLPPAGTRHLWCSLVERKVALSQTKSEVLFYLGPPLPAPVSL